MFTLLTETCVLKESSVTMSDSVRGWGFKFGCIIKQRTFILCVLLEHTTYQMWAGSYVWTFYSVTCVALGQHLNVSPLLEGTSHVFRLLRNAFRCSPSQKDPYKPTDGEQTSGSSSFFVLWHVRVTCTTETKLTCSFPGGLSGFSRQWATRSE